MKLTYLFLVVVAIAALVLFAACRTTTPQDRPELADSVDLNRFMGTWYVHGYTPTALDRDARDATETYELKEDGRIETTYRFRTALEKPWKTYRPVGRVVEGTHNAEWRMRFFWIISQPYLVLHVDAAHRETIIGHPNRKMIWIMTRSPAILEEDYARLREIVRAKGFDLSNLQRVPQQAL